jgi:sortase B
VLVLSVVLIGGAIGISAFFLWPKETDYDAFRPTTQQPTASTVPTESTLVTTEPTEHTEDPAVSTTTEPPLPDNPVDFEALQAVNPDAYAWIYVPNTLIDYPVLQAGNDLPEDFYIYRNLERKYEFRGCIYSQKVNAKDFSDPVTVLYGHHMLDNSMFSTLYYFRDQQFFDTNEFFYIYTPVHILTYRIVSAHQYDERHILNSFDFSKEDVFREYLDEISNPRSMLADVRDGIQLTTEDRIVTLSTCISGGSMRYLVQGVLIDDQPTN